MANNKSRGKYFEDKVASLIRQKLNLSKHQCHRYYESGMAHGEYGDIYVQDIPWIIECKYYKNISIDTLVYSNDKVYDKWIHSIIKDADKYRQVFNKNPLFTIVTSKPRSPILIIIPLTDSNLSNDLIDIHNIEVKLDIKVYHSISKTKCLTTDFKMFLDVLALEVKQI